MYTERDAKIGFGLTRKLPRFNDLKLPNISNMGQLEIIKPRGFGAAEIPIFASRSVYYLLTLLAILCAGCTINQDNRIRELLTVQTGVYSRIRDIQVVSDALAAAPTNRFSLAITQDSSGSFPVFVVKGDGLPAQERFIFAAIDRVSGQIDPQCEFELLADGRLQIFDKKGVSYAQEIPFVVSDGLKAGYPIDYAVVSKKTYAYASAEFIPYPIERIGESNERAELIATHSMGTHLLLHAQGFEPNEPLLLIHTSGSLEENREIAADEMGSFSIGLNPTILGKLGGEARLTIKRSDAAAFAFSYPWGAAIERQTWKERAVFPMLFVVNQDPTEGYQDRLASLLT